METIFSLVTKPINQNIGIIRVSGPETFYVSKKVFPKLKILKNSATFQKLYYKEEFIDDVIVLIFENPNSFTGEDLMEIQFHGSIFVAEKIIKILSNFDIKQAQPGEFTKQAFINGKIDLIQGEAINSLINSEGKFLAELSSLNLNQKESEYINKAILFLNEIISKIQVVIDYPENTDLPKYNLINIKKEISFFQKELEIIIKDSKQIIKIDQGIKLAIIGRPNSGKSSLFNEFLDEEKAIVSNIKGTTRDVIESSIYLEGIKILFQDTAGIHEKSNNKIEKIGIKKAKKVAFQSDITILLLNPKENLESQLKEFNEIISSKNNILKVISKKDLIKKENIEKYKDYILISSKKHQIKVLKEKVSEIIKSKIFDSQSNSALLTNSNQINEFEKLNKILKKIIKMINDNINESIIFFEIKSGLKILNTLIGKEFDDNYINDLFKNFCVGK